ncbi:hypothetical protein AOLI_G00286340 [Acnodon oligacanthus]
MPLAHYGLTLDNLDLGKSTQNLHGALHAYRTLGCTTIPHSRPSTAVPALPFSGSVATISPPCLILPEPQLQLLFSPCSSQGGARTLSGVKPQRGHHGQPRV